MRPELRDAEPFDRSLPSPIAQVLALRASSSDSVVRATGASELQRRAFVSTGLEQRIVDLARQEPGPCLIVLSGSAGGGKSAGIAELIAASPEAFGPYLEDATHADAPDQDQFATLATFLAPLADDGPAYTGRPLLMAMNTGMAIQFFDRLRRSRGDDHGLTRVEGQVRAQLGLGAPQLAPTDGRPVVVVNLDLRPTSGGPGTLFVEMLRRLDPDRDDGIMEGSSRCGTCRVVDWCFVRGNAQLASQPPVRDSLDRIANSISLARARWISPRALWNLAAELVTGGANFGEGDPCDAIATLAAGRDRGEVWRRMIWNGPFLGEREALQGDLLAGVDPSFQPGAAVHGILARAGISGERDAEQLAGWHGGSLAVASAAEALRTGEAGQDRPAIGRGLVRAAALAGALPVDDEDVIEFRATLAEYEGFPKREELPRLERLHSLLATALTTAFGERASGATYFRIAPLDPRRQTTVLVEADLASDRSLLKPEPDRDAAASPLGARVAGHRPLEILFTVAGVGVRVDLPLFRLLTATAGGTLPSSADLERFYALRRAAEALGKRAAALRGSLLIADRAGGKRYRLAYEPDLRNVLQVALREIGR